MKTFIVMTSLLFVQSAIVADEVYIEVRDGANHRRLLVEPEETTFGHFEILGGADKVSDSSVAFENSVQLVSKEVVLTEKTSSIKNGIRTEVTTKRFIPMSHLPWTGKLSGTAVKVFKKTSSNRSANSPKN